jgi:hypothetical protein
MPNMYQVEHDEMYASIRKGEPINDGVWMAHSTLVGIMGRMAAYTGKEITWEQALASQENLAKWVTNQEDVPGDPRFDVGSSAARADGGDAGPDQVRLAPSPATSEASRPRHAETRRRGGTNHQGNGGGRIPILRNRTARRLPSAVGRIPPLRGLRASA